VLNMCPRSPKTGAVVEPLLVVEVDAEALDEMTLGVAPDLLCLLDLAAFVCVTFAGLTVAACTLVECFRAVWSAWAPLADKSVRSSSDSII